MNTSVSPVGYSLPSSRVRVGSRALPVSEVAVAWRARASCFSFCCSAGCFSAWKVASTGSAEAISTSVWSPSAETLPSSEALALLGARVGTLESGGWADKPGWVSMLAGRLADVAVVSGRFGCLCLGRSGPGSCVCCRPSEEG